MRLTQSETFLEMGARTVSLTLPVSKSDQEGRGCKRTLGCVCRGERIPGCPFCAALAFVRSQCSRTGVLPTSSGAADIPLVATVASPFEVVKKEKMIEALRSDVEFLKQVCHEETDYIDIDRITGRPFRRSGAKALAKKGVPLDLIQYMAATAPKQFWDMWKRPWRNARPVMPGCRNIWNFVT